MQQPPPNPDELAAAIRRREQVSRRATTIRRRRVMIPRAAALVILVLAIALPLALGRGASGSPPTPADSGPNTSHPVDTGGGTGVSGPTGLSTSTTAHGTGSSSPTTSSTSSTSGTATTSSTTSSTAVPTTTTIPVSKSLVADVAPATVDTISYLVPAGDTLQLAGVTITIAGGSPHPRGEVTLNIVPPSGTGETRLVALSLSQLVSRGYNSSFSPPISVASRYKVSLTVQCNANQTSCDVTALVTGDASKG